MHKSVLIQEIIEALQPHSNGIYIDATVGAGGHATALLKASVPDGQLFGLDQDQSALEIAIRQLAQFGHRVHLFHANFERLAQVAKDHQIPKADGLLLDLGVSSMQLDLPERGFSFQTDGPLDMRMDTTTGPTAADLVNRLPEDELANLIYRYGEERQSRRIARAIVKARPIEHTVELAQVVAKASGFGRSGQAKIHPATRTFQALRIAVNDEIGELERLLEAAPPLLALGGRLVVVSFHSLEDRAVKLAFRRGSVEGTLRILTKHVVRPGEEEVRRNPASRSARLRAAEKRI